MAREVALTTIDNPFDPIDDVDNWRAECVRLGHDCDGLVASLMTDFDEESDEQVKIDYENVIDSIVQTDPIGIYYKFVKE